MPQRNYSHQPPQIRIMDKEMKEKKQLNKNGDRRGMSLNSQKNLLGVQGIGNPKNNHAKKDCSITRIQRGMMAELCPYAKDPTWTWAYALAEAGMKDALTEEKARENLKDRLEGKVTQPIGGDKENPVYIINVPSEQGKQNVKRVMNGERT